MLDDVVLVGAGSNTGTFGCVNQLQALMIASAPARIRLAVMTPLRALHVTVGRSTSVFGGRQMSQFSQRRNVDQIAARAGDSTACLADFDRQLVSAGALDEVFRHDGSG